MIALFKNRLNLDVEICVGNRYDQAVYLYFRRRVALENRFFRILQQTQLPTGFVVITLFGLGHDVQHVQIGNAIDARFPAKRSDLKRVRGF